MVKNQSIKKNSLAPTILVSGGAGFIGSHLVEALLANGAKVLVADNFNTGKEIHVKHLLSNPNFALFNVDINEGLPPEIESVDYVFHMAGLEDYMYSNDNPTLDSLLTNSLGTKTLLDLVRRSEAKFVLISTVDVYQGRMSQDELAKYFGLSKPEENKFSLIEAKRFAEAVVWEYYKKYDLDVRIVRLPEVYGPRMSLDSSGVMGVYIRTLIENKDIEVQNDGVEKEYYLYVSDAVSGILRSMFNQETKGNIYSLVPESAITQLELAYLLRSVADGNLQISFKQSGFSFPFRGPAPDTFNLKDLSWRPRISLKSGVVDTLKWFGYSVNQNTFKPTKYVEEKAISRGMQTTTVRPLESTKVSSIYPANSEDLYTKMYPVKTVKSRKRLSLRSLFNFHRETSAVKSAAAPKRLPGVLGSSKFYIAVALFVSAALVFLVNPVFSLYSNARSGATALQNVAAAGSSLDVGSLSKNTVLASNKFEVARKNLSNLKWVFSFSGKSSEYISYFRMLSSLQNFSDSVEHLSKSAEPLEGMWEVLRPDTENVLTRETVNTAKLEIDSAQKLLYIAQADFNGVNKEHIPEKYRSYISDYGKYISTLQQNLDLTTKLIGEAAAVLGVDKETTYIVWFQNSNELRPTGGFIGSYGLLTFDKGKLKDLKIDDIYNPDGQILLRDIKTTPPEVISRYLAEDRLYLRNSNWDPDFPTAAGVFNELFYKIDGQSVDGYLAVDLKFVEGILRATGPVFLAAYNEEINAANLYERTQYHSDFNYVNGSDQKRSFLTILGSKLLEKMFSLPKDKLPSLLAETQKSLDEKHLLINISNGALNDVLKEKNWNGQVVPVETDYLYVVNSNLGGTKANYFVKNNIDYEINSMTRDGVLRATLKLTYDHTGESMAWPGGPYKDHVRVLVQKGSKLTGAEFVDAAGNTVDVFKDVGVGQPNGYDIFSYDLVVNPKETVSLVIKYDLPESLNVTKDKSTYSLYVQKQPGTDADPFSFTFNAPFGTEIIKASKDLDILDNAITKTSGLRRDINYFIELR
ncbi:hypothetical protein A2274_03465 [candidate division WWE3 bacterium RIFOXYA12_FULL_43_11]|uniref:NAD-dependent epimerase/dehydratase domain-containing protein n=2 Tax=Katanobacteria TaxID=422282 RepID=A0A3D0ZPN0_UNCKA|nr:MAG: hypothetical protein A2274_03465 [candidate division WWE3 bacterium RIFOXYA12_FULL_43_11]HBY10263.1 hypothetical protein [candidate division WWE3 bacterium]HCC42066.1 hypothetical protein [candidate division WWE3 bacterium]